MICLRAASRPAYACTCWHVIHRGAVAPQIAPLSTSKGPGEGGEPHQFYYPDGDADVGVIAYGTPAGADAQIAKLVAGEAAKAIKAKGAFTLVLTGGKRV